ncbi:MAG: aminotransferase class III-fold pyridoxal phosphate-dependent enzyme [Gemmatimonadota bacterium]|nr:aminotransferase class III-fold pyridoxal phosphate-dependent enzyme [Gemmatimonadota bacterium]
MIPGFTSTGSKNPEKLFGTSPDSPRRIVRADGYRVWDDTGREFVDTIMALGSVSLGYAHPVVTQAAVKAVKDGAIGPLAPKLEGEVAELLLEVTGFGEAVRFFKTGAEAVSAAIRLARVITEKSPIVTCGYHGWLDQLSSSPGVPVEVEALRHEIPFNDVPALKEAVKVRSPAAFVIEPVVDEAPSADWIAAIHEAKTATGALLVLDEIKTGLRLGNAGALGRYGFEPDLVVYGKAIGNGFPMAAVTGSQEVMRAATKTWISSTLATEFVSLAACKAVLELYRTNDVARHLAGVGKLMWESLSQVVDESRGVVERVGGIEEFCYLSFVDDEVSKVFASLMAKEGILFKRNAYNFVALPHDVAVVDRIAESALKVMGKLAG